MQSETIRFEDKAAVEIPWTAYRQQRFGLFPFLQVWLTIDGKHTKANIPAIADAMPPATTKLTINFGGAVTGFIQIK